MTTHSTISMTYNKELLIVNVLISIHGKNRTVRITEEVLKELIARIQALKSVKDSDLIKLAYYASAANKECDMGLMVALNLAKALIYNGTTMLIKIPTTAKKKPKDHKDMILGSDEYLASLDLADFVRLPADTTTSSKPKAPKKALLDEQQLGILERDAKLLEDMDANMLKYLEDM